MTKCPVMNSTTAYPTQYTDELVQLESDNYIRLEELTKYSETTGNFGGVFVEYRLNAGIYKPELHNEFGTFYRGPEGCVTQTIHKSERGPFDGGIWIPKDKVNHAPRIYIYHVSDTEQAMQAGGLIAAVISESETGKIGLMGEVSDPEFINKLVVTNLD